VSSRRHSLPVPLNASIRHDLCLPRRSCTRRCARRHCGERGADVRQRACAHGHLARPERGTAVNTGRVGFFSDIYYDPNRSEWWALSDRGPGGGALDYATRAPALHDRRQRATGAISNFQIQQTVLFTDAAGRR
jgi:hypothetical protein